MAVPEKILLEVDTLREQIENHNRLYHSQDAPEIPDADFDALLRRLEELETRYELYDEASPSQRIGGEAIAGFSQVRHENQHIWLVAQSSETAPRSRWPGEQGPVGSQRQWGKNAAKEEGGGPLGTNAGYRMGNRRAGSHWGTGRRSQGGGDS